MSIKEIIKETRIGFCSLIALKGIRDNNTYHLLRGLYSDELNLQLECRGEGMQGHVLYDIALDDPRLGFFALMRTVLCCLAFADTLGIKSYVSFPKDSLYSEKGVFHGTVNAFEYYFRPVSEITKKDIDKASRVLTYQPKQPKAFVEGYDENKIIALLAKEYSKYIRLNENVENEILKCCELILQNKKTLGIHYRGTDYKDGYKGHPIGLKPDDYFIVLNSMIEKYKFEQVFIATDERDAINIFSDHLQIPVKCFEDVKRSTDGHAVHTSIDNRENHQYRLGFEVLRDVICLSYCDGLVAGLSNVSTFAQTIKMSRNEKYVTLIIISKGINKTGKKFTVHKN